MRRDGYGAAQGAVAWGVTCVLVLAAGETRLSLDEAAALVRDAVGDAPQQAQAARARLAREAVQAPLLVRDLAARLAREYAYAASLAGRSASAADADAFFAMKLGEAEAAFDRGRYGDVRVQCDALLALGASGEVRVRILRLRRLARDREFLGDLVSADLRSEKPILAGGESLRCVLSIVNRSDAQITIRMELGARLAVLTTAVYASGQPFEEGVSEDVPLPSGPVKIAPGDAWQHAFVLPVRAPRAEVVLERITVRGSILRARVDVSGRVTERTLRIPLLVVYRVPPGGEDMVAQPLVCMRAALDREDPTALLGGAVVALWEGEADAAVRLLLEGTARGGAAGDACYYLLALLTGENHGRDRRKWILYYLGRREVSGGGAQASP